MVMDVPDIPYSETLFDTLRIEGMDWFVDGKVGLSVDPVSDYAQGVKTGSIDYDQRLHAFFQAIDDHSAGEGYDVVSSREDVGVYSNAPLGVDSRRSKHLMAPPLTMKLRQVKNAASLANQDRHPITGCNNAALFDSGVLAIYFPGFVLTTTDGFVWKKVSITDVDVAMSQSKLTQVFNVGATWHAIYQCFEPITGVMPTCVDVTSTTGATFASSAFVNRWDTIYYNGNYYSIVDTQIGVAATFDGATANFGILPPGRGMWLGAMLGPNGKVDLYFTKAGRLFFAEPVGQTISEVNLGPGFIVAGGNFFDGAMIVTDGQTSIAYTSDGFTETIRDIGYQNFRFAPHDVEAGLIRALAADELNLYTALQHDVSVHDGHSNETHIAAYNGRGWHPLATIQNFFVLNMGVGWVPPTGWPVTTRGLFITGIRGSKKPFEVIRPTGAGNYTAWTGTFADVDEYFPSSADQISTPGTSNNIRESFTHPALSGVPAGMKITGVRLVYWSDTNSGDDPRVTPFLRIGGVDYDGTPVLPNNTWFSQLWATNPAGGDWDAAGVNGAEFGFNHTQTGVGSNSTKVYTAYLLVTFGDDTAEGEVGSLELQVLMLPPAGSVPSPNHQYFSQVWDLYEGWNDGGFIDLRGILYEYMASGIFSTTEYVDVYYAIDDDETETYLGRIDASGEVLKFGPSEEGVNFRNFRLHLKGFASAADEGVVNTDLGDTNQAMGDAAARTRIGQGFKIDSTQAVHFVQLYMRKVGAPVDDLTITLEADSGGSPDGTALATSDVYNGANFDTEYSWHTFRFSTPATLTGATQYHMVMRRSGAVDGANYYQVRSDGSAPTYADGEAKSYNPAVWSALNSDLVFNVMPDRKKTADMRGFVVAYDKRPEYRAQIQATFLLNEMVDKGVQLNGEPATVETLMQELYRYWNFPTLLRYEIPGIRAGLVRMASMPMVVTEQNNRERINASAQLLEPVIRKRGLTV